MNLNALSTSGAYREHAEFWKARLAGLEDDFRLRQNWQSYALPYGPAPEHALVLDEAADQVLRRLSKDKELGAFVVVLAAALYVLGKYSGAQEVFVLAPRLAPAEASGNLPLVAPDAEGGSVRDYLNRVRERVQDSYVFQDFPVAEFGQSLLGRRPASNVHLSYQGLHAAGGDEDACELAIAVRGGERHSLALHASPEAFTRHFLEHFARHLRNVVFAFGDLDLPLASLSLLDAQETDRLAPIPPAADTGLGTFLDAFAERAKAAPSAIAVATAEGSLSYAELDERSTRLAHFLRSEYALQPGDVVGVLSDRSERWIVGILGILKAGGVYLPLDPDYPQPRLRFMIEDAQVKALLVHSQYLALLTDFWAIPMFALDFQLDTLEAAPAAAVAAVGPDDAAYVIYTSGSTGAPKGVLLEHRGLLNMARFHVDAFGFTPDDRFIQFYSPSFDGSIMEIFVTLLAGARLVLAGTALIKDVPQFVAYAAEQGVTTINATPAYLAALDWAALGSVKRVISAGDHARVQEAVALARGRSHHNSYGPTEATVCAADYVVDPELAYGARIPIGRPVRNQYIVLLDEQGAPVPEGCIGEICIGGVGLARGYLNRDELTAAAFIAHPRAPGERLYRSGDLGVWLPDGNLEVCGRRDAQVKIRGFRIELGEIESALLQHPAVEQAAVLVREDGGRKQLIAYLAPAAADQAELREHLRGRLPDFMTPAAFVMLERLPFTPNGKLDRKALAALPIGAAPARGEYAAPGSELEARLAGIWAAVLGLEKVGVNDNFFELGADSILIIQAVSRAQLAGIRITAQQHFERPSVAALAEVAVATAQPAASQETVAGPAALTPVQHWFFAQDVADPHHYNQSSMLEIPAALEASTLAQALHHLVVHHDALRLGFSRNGKAWEAVHAAPPAAADIGSSAFAGSPDEHAAEVLATAAELQRSFDLAQGPLLRAHLFRFGPGHPSRLLLVAHHLVIDGVSWRILLEDFHTACRQLQAGEPLRLPPKTTAFRDWSARLADWGKTAFEGLDYWRRQAAETRRSAFRDLPTGTIGEAASVEVELDAEDTRALLQDAPRALNTQINEVLLAALLLAFRGWTGDPALVVDLEGHGREDLFEDTDLSRTVGWFTSHYPVALAAEPGDTPAEVLRKVKEQLREVPTRGLGYGVARYLRADAESRAELERQPEPPVRFNYLGQIDHLLPENAGWKLLPGANGGEHSPRARRAHLFEIEGMVHGGRLQLSWIFNPAVHGRAEIEQLARRYLDGLRGLAAHGGQAQHGRSAAARPDPQAAKTAAARTAS